MWRKSNLVAEIKPPIAMAELINAVGKRAMTVNLATRTAVSNVSRPVEQRLVNHAPESPASGVPSAMKTDSTGEPFARR